MKSLLVLSQGGKKRGYEDYIYDKFLIDKDKTFIVTVSNYPDSYKLLKLIKNVSQTSFDNIYAIGGGSVIDIAKVLSVFIPISSQREVKNLQKEDLKKYDKNKIHLTAIPTTSGTGSEVTQFATIWDSKNLNKYSIDNILLLPEEFLLDSKLLETLSYEQFLYPVLDCISHTLESIWNNNRNEKSLAFSKRALEILSNEIINLKQKNYKSMNFHNMLLASNLAGQAINITRTSIAHAISYEYTLKLDIPHGLACSFTIRNIHEIVKNEIKDSIYRSYSNLIEPIIDNLKSLNLTDMVYQYQLKNKNQINLSSLNSSRLETFIGNPNHQTLKRITSQ